MYRKNPVSAAFLKARHDKTLALLDGISPASILDVGCDDGEFLARLAKRFPSAKLYGCDSDADALEEARKTCQKAELVQEDFMKHSFKPVDLVVMLEVVEHMKDPQRMLKKAASLIGKDGHVLVSMPRPELLRWRLTWALWSNTFGRRWHGQHTNISEAGMRRMAGESGLKIEKRSRFFFDCISITLFRRGSPTA